MMPQEYVDAVRVAKKRGMKFCKNADFQILHDKIDMENKIFTMKFEHKEGSCQNDRRHSSAYCQACSDKHREEIQLEEVVNDAHNDML